MATAFREAGDRMEIAFGERIKRGVRNRKKVKAWA